jgi:hypothetical protein
VIEYIVGRIKYLSLPGAVSRAARANRVFCTDEKRIRTENTVMANPNPDLGGYPRSMIAYGCAFHPYAIIDPRVRPFVRAKLKLRGNGNAI